MVKSINNNDCSILFDKINALNVYNITDKNEIYNLSELIFKKWNGMKSSYRDKIFNGSDVNKELFASYEAEEDIVIGLLFLLLKKVVDSVKQIKQKR